MSNRPFRPGGLVKSDDPLDEFTLFDSSTASSPLVVPVHFPPGSTAPSSHIAILPSSSSVDEESSTHFPWLEEVFASPYCIFLITHLPSLAPSLCCIGWDHHSASFGSTWISMCCFFGQPRPRQGKTASLHLPALLFPFSIFLLVDSSVDSLTLLVFLFRSSPSIWKSDLSSLLL